MLQVVPIRSFESEKKRMMGAADTIGTSAIMDSQTKI